VRHFTAHRLLIRATVIEPVLLNQHKGSALRGALYHSLRNRFCTLVTSRGRTMRHQRRDCIGCPLRQVCPVCTLVSTLAPGSRLGRDAARPYTIQPPLDAAKTLYRPGEQLQFGLTLYAQAMQLFPYVVMALYSLEEEGLGRRDAANDWRRGTLRIDQIWADNPLTGQRQVVSTRGSDCVQVPDIPITHQQVVDAAKLRCERASREAVHGPAEEVLEIELLTPLRLTTRGHLVKPGQVTFRVFLGRLLDRLESLAQHFSDTPLELDFAALVHAAEAVRTVDDATRWVELRSYSTRQRRATPIGGLMGSRRPQPTPPGLAFAAHDWAPFLPWLIWGRFTHLGKDAVKGNGWYRLIADGRYMSKEMKP